MLAIIETHPVQYHAPVYRVLRSFFEIPVTVIYGSDFSLAGYHDREFGVSLTWDTDLLTGYDSRFLSRVGNSTNKCYETTQAYGLKELLEKLAPQAIMLLGYGSRFDRAAIFDAWRLKKPMLFRAETTDHTMSAGRVKAKIKDASLRRLYQRFSRLLYIGQHSLQHYQRLAVPNEKLIFSPYCVEASAFAFDEKARLLMRDVTRREYGLSDGDIVLLFSGKISERKGANLLIQAVKALPDDLRTRVSLLFLGDGALRESMRALADDAPAVRVHFLGFHNQTQLSRFYHAADALVLPSRRGETWGLVVNEALHHGVPCIVSDAVGCAPDLIKPGITGYGFVNNSVLGLVEAIQQTIPLMNQLAVREKCRNKVSGYSVTEAARGIAKAYRQITRTC